MFTFETVWDLNASGIQTRSLAELSTPGVFGVFVGYSPGNEVVLVAPVAEETKPVPVPAAVAAATPGG